MGKTEKPNLVETDSAKTGKSKSSKGAPKARRTRGRTVNRRRERAMRKALEKLDRAKTANDTWAANNLADQLALMKEAQARRVAKPGGKK